MLEFFLNRLLRVSGVIAFDDETAFDQSSCATR
jgi:hypothetical protein